MGWVEILLQINKRGRWKNFPQNFYKVCRIPCNSSVSRAFFTGCGAGSLRSAVFSNARVATLIAH